MGNRLPAKCAVGVIVRLRGRFIKPISYFNRFPAVCKWGFTHYFRRDGGIYAKNGSNRMISQHLRFSCLFRLTELMHRDRQHTNGNDQTEDNLRQHISIVLQCLFDN